MRWMSATGSTLPLSSESSLSEMSVEPSPSQGVTGATRPQPLHIFPFDEHRVVNQASQSAPPVSPSFARKPFDRLTNSTSNSNTGTPRAVDPVRVQASPSKLSSDPPSRGIPESTGHDAEHEVSEDDIEVPRDDGGGMSDRPFRIEWIRTDALPFFRTRQVRNPWNHGREVKISRDGTELEPNVGRQLLDEWDNNLPGRRRGAK
jgi:hypothetical protein